MSMRSAYFGLVALVIAGAVRSEPDIQPLQPTSHWVIDYADTMCTASRTYGDRADPITFGISPTPDGQYYKLLFERNRAGPEYALELQGTIDFGNGPIDAWLLHYGNLTKRHDVYQFRISAAQMQQAVNASAVTLRSKGGPDTSFALAAMGPLLSGLGACTADLRRYWNADDSKISGASGDVRSVFTGDDYPTEANDRNQEGQATYILLIDENGKVAGCDVVKPSGIPALDAEGCQVMRMRAKFTPAHDSSGKPVRSTYVSPPIKWMQDR